MARGSSLSKPAPAAGVELYRHGCSLAVLNAVMSVIEKRRHEPKI